MSFLNSMIKAAVSSLIKENPELMTKVASLLSQLLSQTGGVSGLIQKFKDNGLGEIVSSWMSEGERLPISTDQIEQVVGKDFLANLASEANLDTSIFSTLLTQSLPKLVSTLTQEGQVAPEDVLELSLENAQKIIEKLLS
ncbi:MAG: YidB family protein [Saezia sp.]